MLLKKTTLKSIDFSGGEPTLHPDFQHKRSQLLKWQKKYPNIRFSFHTNGILLLPDFIDEIKDSFARIGIAIHSFNFDTWDKMTNFRRKFSSNVQVKKFKNLQKNIEYLAKQNIGHKVFVKNVIMKGVNDSIEEIRLFLDKCNYYKFHPKFLEFEPQYPNQKKYVLGRKELFSKMRDIGCKFSDDIPDYRNEKTYIPAITFKYKDAPLGLHGIFGCGSETACNSCCEYMCMFVKSYQNGNGLYLKPCSVLDTRFDLTHAIKTQNYDHLLELFKMSREYLLLTPGIGSYGWNKEDEFKFGI